MSNSTSGGSACNNFSRQVGASPQFRNDQASTCDGGRGAAGAAAHPPAQVDARHKDGELRAENGVQNGPILGNYAKSSSTPQKSIWDADAKTRENYAMQFMARQSMLEAFYSIPEDQRPKKPHRVCNCRRDLRPVEIGRDAKGKRQFSISKPEIYKHASTGNTFFGGLMICGSPYACSVCAPKINEIDAAEIRHAVSEWVKQGGICLFVTLTFPHHRTDTFAEMMQQFTKGALGRFRSGRVFAEIRKDLQYSGVIRSIEVTWGDANGFHPHSHEIWFVKPDFLYQHPVVDWSSFDKPSLSSMGKELKQFLLEPMKMRIFERWRSACVSSGLSAPSYERGVDVRIAETEAELQARLAEYFTKTGIEKSGWGVDDEMTRHNTKKGKAGRFTPFDFLRHQFNPQKTKTEKARYRRLFAEYVIGFKGVSKIYWSPGLKKHFDIKEISEQAKAEQKTEQASLEYTVPPAIWVFVVAINDHRAELLLKVKNEGVQAAKDFLSSLLDRYAEYLDERYDELPAVYQYILESITDEKT